MESSLTTCRMTSPFGGILIVANARGDALCGLYFEGQKYFPPDAHRWREAPAQPVLRQASVQLRDYFSGARTQFDLPLSPEGTPFQRAVWMAIAGVPFGCTITYAELASRCGRPSAIRAAGAATGRNPITIVIPCHRIVGSGGALTGYAGGLPRKQGLLEREHALSAGDPRKVA